MRLGPQHIVVVRLEHIAVECFTIPRQKTGVLATIQIHPELRAIIDSTSPTGMQTFLITKNGQPFKPGVLSNRFRRWCDEAGIDKRYTIHGLRHRLGDALAETGSGPSGIGAILGHASARSSLHYTQGADRVRMALAAMAPLITGRTPSERNEHKGVSENNPPQTVRSKKA